MKTQWIGFFVVIIFISANGWTQEPATYKGELIIPDSSQYQIIETRDGADWEGRITEITETSVQFVTKFGDVNIPIQDIKEINTLEMTAVKEGQFWFPNPNTSRLFFAPTGRMLPQGEGYFADYYILFPSLTFGITNNFTLGGGMSLIPGAGLDHQLYFITPKIGLKASESMHIAAGALAIVVPSMESENGEDDENREDDEEPFSMGILYGVGTIGSPDKSFTIGLGYGYTRGNLADSPLLVLGGEIRSSAHIAIVSENWFGGGMDGGVLSLGVRFFGRRLSADLALGVPVGFGGESFALPYIDFVYAF
ncbi:hypothetical protein HQ585_17280 [candidate division KSB1 bacterium]|nr:hypothetical protein [candidate division KSB1 bacterium]